MVGINVNIRPVVINRNEKEQYKMVFILESIGDNIVIPKQLSFIEIDPYELQICLDKNKNIVLNLYNIENFTTDNQFLGINKLYDEVICTLEGALLRNQLILNEETYKTFEAVMYNIQQKRYKKLNDTINSTVSQVLSYLAILANEVTLAFELIEGHKCILLEYKKNKLSDNFKKSLFNIETQLGDLRDAIVESKNSIFKRLVVQGKYNYYIEKYHKEIIQTTIQGNFDIMQGIQVLTEDYLQMMYKMCHIH
jgi:hypothetical protein